MFQAIRLAGDLLKLAGQFQFSGDSLQHRRYPFSIHCSGSGPVSALFVDFAARLTLCWVLVLASILRYC